jgi:hypothetical protein
MAVTSPDARLRQRLQSKPAPQNLFLEQHLAGVPVPAGPPHPGRRSGFPVETAFAEARASVPGFDEAGAAAVELSGQRAENLIRPPVPAHDPPERGGQGKRRLPVHQDDPMAPIELPAETVRRVVPIVEGIGRVVCSCGPAVSVVTVLPSFCLFRVEDGALPVV